MTRPAANPAAARRAAPGFTMLELLVVVTLIGVLLGLGVGFLQRTGDDFELALATVRDQLRVAHLSARTRHQPSEVRIEPATDARQARVRARILEPVGMWHMEERSSLDDDVGLEVALTGRVEPGRFGAARRPDLERPAALLRVPTEGRARFDLRDGFFFRVDLRLDAADAMSVMRLGTGLELEIDASLLPRARMVTTRGGDRTGSAVDLSGSAPLRLGLWHTLELVHDGRELALIVDGRDADRAAVAEPLLQAERDELIVSDPEAPVLGLVDSVALWAYALGIPQLLPQGIEIDAEPLEIRFDRHGDLVGSAAFALRSGEDRRSYTVGPGGVVR